MVPAALLEVILMYALVDVEDGLLYSNVALPSSSNKYALASPALCHVFVPDVNAEALA